MEKAIGEWIFGICASANDPKVVKACNTDHLSLCFLSLEPCGGRAYSYLPLNGIG
jgi:hypothetical protein